MPRRKRAFSRLEAQAAAAGYTAAAGTALARYLDFKLGKTKKDANKTRTEAQFAEQRDTRLIAIIPFNQPAGATPSAYQTTITVWSNNGRTSFGLSDAETGFYDPTGTLAADGFYPAVIRPFVPTGLKGTQTSGITGREYTTRIGNSYTIPFGRRGATAATDSEEQRRQELSDACRTVASATNRASTVGYEPEVWRRESRQAGELAGLPTAPGVT